MKRRLVFVLMLSTLGSMATAGSLSGTVLDRSTMLPVAEAIVAVHVLLPDSIAFRDTTDEQGAYLIEEIAPGNEIYVVMAGKPGYRGYYLRHDRIGAGSYGLDILLELEEVPPPGGGGDSSEISGQVLGRHGTTLELAPVPGAEVRLVSGGAHVVATTDQLGEYRSVVPAGSYGITVSASGYEPTTAGGVLLGAAGLTFGAVLSSSVTDVGEAPGRTPERFALLGAYPNPFNPTTHIRYQVPGSGLHLRLIVCNVLGEEVALLVNGPQDAGRYEVAFDAQGLPSGLYLCRLTSGRFVESVKLILSR